MRAPLRLGYGALAQLARGAAIIAPPGDSKLLRSLRGRRGIRDRYRAWAANRDLNRPLLWMHAPSVGEGLQARPVLQLARQRRRDAQLAYTWFSPSAVQFAQSLDVDFRDYLPFDTPRDSVVALDALRPTALVFSKLDVWPTLTTLAHERGVALGMVSATLSRTSSRGSRAASAVLRAAYASLDAVGAIQASDADRLVRLGVRPAVIAVTGDARYDQVWQRAQDVDRGAPLIATLAGDRPTLVAGSTWPADEAVLLAAFAATRARHVTEARMIIAPHEPTREHLESIRRWARDQKLALATLDEPLAARADVVLVDRVGVLGDLYALADVAYVGGAFHAAGLHSVLEPAAFGAPVLFGPRHEGSRDAGLLLARGGGYAAEHEAELTRRLTTLLRDPSERRAAGDAARAVVRGGLGAAERSFQLVQRLLR